MLTMVPKNLWKMMMTRTSYLSSRPSVGDPDQRQLILPVTFLFEATRWERIVDADHDPLRCAGILPIVHVKRGV